jgi:Fe-S oxidoreductase
MFSEVLKQIILPGLLILPTVQNGLRDWNIKTMAEDSNGEILFWVGCAGSFDNRYKKVSSAFAQIMQKAGINFRILGTEEKCNGDTARRLRK